MGSNQNRFGDKKVSEWGSKARKEESHHKKRAKEEFAIEDSALSNEVTAGFDSPDLEDAPFYTPPPPKRKRKDTKRWCRGKEGQEHDFPETPYKQYSWFRSFKVFRCNRCGKEKFERG